MLDIRLLLPARIQELKLNQVFVSLPEGIPFVRGKINETDVLISLSGERPFHCAPPEAWSRNDGYVISDVRFEVDRYSAVVRHSEGDMSSGELIRFPSGYGLCCVDRITNYLAALSGLLDDSRQAIRLIGFSRWDLVVGQADDRQVLYHFDQGELRYGAYEPDIDG